MNKIKYILLLLTCLFLTGCENYDLDYNTINCSLDKSSYRTDEKIVLSCEGCFAENNFQGYLAIELDIHKIENDELIKGKVPIKVEDCGNLENIACTDVRFQAYIQENTDFKEVNEKIILNISDYEAGEYELHVILESCVNHTILTPLPQTKDFLLKFLVTEE
jgi:hypothetical protein